MNIKDSEIKKISKIWDHFKIEGYINIYKSNSKEISYNPLGEELSFNENDDNEINIVLIKNNKKITIKTNNLLYEDIKKKIEENIDLLQVSSSDKDIFLPNIKNNISFDERKFEIKNIKKDFLLKQWKTVKNFKYNKNISIESFSYGLEEREKIFLNSLGSYKIYKNTFCGHALELYYTYSDFSDVEYESKISSLNQNIDLNFIKNIQEKLLRKSNPEKTKLNNGKYNITFDARLVGEFLNIITNACSGEKIRQNQSMFSIKDLGKNALDDKLTLVTNPSINLSAYNRKFDNEGISTEKLIIIKNGVLENIFLDSKNAKKFKQKPTGNPNFSNLELIGEFSKDYLKTSSFLFTNLMALHTIDMITGKFALQGEGFEIKNGKLGNFIKNVGISGDLKSLFSSIYKLGDNIYTNSNIFTPGITFKNQNIIV